MIFITCSIQESLTSRFNGFFDIVSRATQGCLAWGTLWSFWSLVALWSDVYEQVHSSFEFYTHTHTHTHTHYCICRVRAKVDSIRTFLWRDCEHIVLICQWIDYKETDDHEETLKNYKKMQNNLLCVSQSGGLAPTYVVGGPLTCLHSRPVVSHLRRWLDPHFPQLVFCRPTVGGSKTQTSAAV